MSKNTTLAKANRAKNDEFYTQLDDVERELKHYKEQFRGKVILCNCDDPYESAFFKFFAQQFDQLGLKKLIATCYAGSTVAGNELPLPGIPAKVAYKVEITEVPSIRNDGSRCTPLDVEYLLTSTPSVLTRLESNGDFRSAECIAILREADIVVTNPPFSLFREYVAQLVEYDKKFLVIGNMNAITYKETFKLIQENKLWLGYSSSGKKWFRVPDNYDHTTSELSIKIENGIRYLALCNIAWYTNLDTDKRHEFLDLDGNRYSSEKYPTYINYPAIEVSKVADIPADYDGAMGVPITFLDKYNSEQFEIIGSSYLLAKAVPNCESKGEHRFYLPEINGKYYGKYQRLYERIVIRKIKA